MSMTQTLRHAMHDSGLSIKRLSVLSGVPYAAVHRFYKAEGDIQLATADKLASVVGLELRKLPKSRAPKPAATARRAKVEG